MFHLIVQMSFKVFNSVGTNSQNLQNDITSCGYKNFTRKAKLTSQ